LDDERGFTEDFSLTHLFERNSPEIFLVQLFFSKISRFFSKSTFLENVEVSGFDRTSRCPMAQIKTQKRSTR
jgi:hypothetical protein